MPGILAGAIIGFIVHKVFGQQATT